jgi:hypothetical protein
VSRAALLAAALLLAACGRGAVRLAPGEQGEVVESEGWAPIDDADVLGTKRRSLADAQKKAVETVVGVFISAKTRVDQTVSIDERILADLNGNIRRYEILGERREDGFLKTRIRAVVLYKKVGEELKQLGLTKPPPPPGNPRVAVRLEPALEREAAQALRRAFAAAGFAVVDGSGAGDSDILIRGEAASHRLDGEGLGGLHSSRARLTIEAVKTKSGEVLASRAQEASALDVSDDAAAAKAQASAGALAGDALVKELSPLLKTQIGIAVTVDGLPDLAAVRRIADDIRLNPGVDAATLADFRDGSAQISVTAEDLSGPDLASMITRNKALGLTAVSASTYAVELRHP